VALKDPISALDQEGFAFLPSVKMRAQMPRLADWAAFAASWDDLRPDVYRPEKDRLRRHAVLSAEEGRALRVEPPQPHYQAPQYNSLYGGVARSYEPIAAAVLAGKSLGAILTFARDVFDGRRDRRSWKVELHQVRITAAQGKPGSPTPEGVHRDGVDFVLVMLVRRENVRSGTTTVHDLKGAPLGAFTLETPLDCALVDDARVLHGVTPIEALDPAKPAFRDVLICTFQAKP
jgi:hypothetical protein